MALSPDRSGPPLAATLPCGVRTFLPPRERRATARPPPAHGSAASASRSPPRRSGAPVQHALAARAEDHPLVALDLVEELRRDAHAAALARAARGPRPPRRRRGARRSSRTCGGGRRRRSATSSVAARRARARSRREPGELSRAASAASASRAAASRASSASRPASLGARRLDLLHHADELGLERRRSPPSGARPRACASPSSLSLRMRVMRIRRSFILASAAPSRASRSRWRAVERRELGARCGGGGRLRAAPPPRAPRPALSPSLDLQRLGPQALVDELQASRGARSASPTLTLLSSRRRRSRLRRRWAQCDSNTRPTGYEPAALTA